MHTCFLACGVSSPEARLLCHLSPLSFISLAILTIGPRSEIQDGVYHGGYLEVSYYRHHFVHMALYGSFNKWSEQLLPEQRWFTVDTSGLNDYRNRRLLTFWCALDSVIVLSSPTPPGKLHACLWPNISIQKRKHIWNIITPSKSSIIWTCQPLLVYNRKTTHRSDLALLVITWQSPHINKHRRIVVLLTDRWCMLKEIL